MDEARLRGVKCHIIRMCGTRLAERASGADLCQKVGIDRIIEDLIVQNRLHWYGYV